MLAMEKRMGGGTGWIELVGVGASAGCGFRAACSLDERPRHGHGRNAAEFFNSRRFRKGQFTALGVWAGFPVPVTFATARRHCDGTATRSVSTRRGTT